MLQHVTSKQKVFLKCLLQKKKLKSTKKMWCDKKKMIASLFVFIKQEFVSSINVEDFYYW